MGSRDTKKKNYIMLICFNDKNKIIDFYCLRIILMSLIDFKTNRIDVILCCYLFIEEEWCYHLPFLIEFFNEDNILIYLLLNLKLYKGKNKTKCYLYSFILYTLF